MSRTTGGAKHISNTTNAYASLPIIILAVLRSRESSNVENSPARRLSILSRELFGDRQVYIFNQRVLKALRVIALGGIAAGGMRHFEQLRKFDQSQKLKNYYMIAKNSLEKGDWKTANQAIRSGGAIGSYGENLINEPTKLGYYREAIIFEGEWKGRLLELRAVEAGQPVPRVPNNFEAYERG